MKLLLLCLLPAVFAAPEKRFIIDSIFSGTPFDLTTLKCDVQLLVDTVGSDPGEQACENECNKLVADGTLFSYGCPLVCHGLQNLVHMFHIVPETSDPSISPCQKPVQKRFFIDSVSSIFDLDTLKCDVQMLLDVLGSDPSETACENECHVLLSDGHVFNYGCPLICQGFKAAIHTFHIVPDTSDPTVSKCARPAMVLGK